jgi:hypothetical protein
MRKLIEMHIDFVTRTRELLADRRESYSELAWHTDLDQKWIARFATCQEAEAKCMDASFVARLHDWLIVLELESSAPIFGPLEALLRFGPLAVYMYEQRQDPSDGGLLIQNERAHTLNAARATLTALRTFGYPLSTAA